MTPADDAQLAIPPGSLVVVTGANGNIASHVVDQLLKAGYRVRGTTRNTTKSAWLVEHFGQKYGPGKIELAEVSDMATKGAFDEAVKGAAGIIHTATPVMDSADPNKAIKPVIDGVLNVLESAAKEPSIKRVVLTSSSGAQTAPRPNEVFTIDSTTWNKDSVKKAWKQPPDDDEFELMLSVYYASKTQSEQEAWKWVKEHQPGFVLNTVLPNANFGPITDPEHQGMHSTQGWIKALWDGFEGQDDVRQQPPQYFVNIVDDALVHVAALIYDDVRGERLMAFAYPYNWNDILAILREQYPDRRIIDDIPDLGRDLSKVANERAEELLKRISGHGWTGLRETVKQSVGQYV